jgi:urate oxidase / 2-oxo-4-hydroxy-4-carboxy-5-ureidoimidazoline decarboxylase
VFEPNAVKGVLMRTLLSGKKQSYYGKGETVVYRLHKAHHLPPILAAKVTMVIWGDAFWRTYTTGDNTGLIATDSMKNFVHRETLHYPGETLEGLIYFLGKKFLEKYPQAEGAEFYAEEIPFEGAGVVALQPSGAARGTAQTWLARDGNAVVVRDLVSGLAGYQLLRATGSAFYGFVRDEYTTLPEMQDRPLRMFLETQWRYADALSVLEAGVALEVDRVVRETFNNFESGSIQQVIYQIGCNVIAQIPSIAEIDLEGQNHTWDMVVDGGNVGVFTVAKPFYGILGVSVKR